MSHTHGAQFPIAWYDIVVGLALPATSWLPPCHAHTHASHRLFRRLALGQRTRLRPQLPHGLYNEQAVGAADAAAAGIGNFSISVLAAARMVEGMPRLSALDFSDVDDSFGFTAFMLAAQRHLQARQRMTAVAGYSTTVLHSVDPALLAACLPHLQRFEGQLPYVCGARCLRALACACPLQQLSCSLDQCDEVTAAAIAACATLRSLKLKFRWHMWNPGTEGDPELPSTQTIDEGLLLPALAGLTRLTSLEVASQDSYYACAMPAITLQWPDLAPLAALTALQRLRLSCWGPCDDDLTDLRARLLQLPAGSLSALTQLCLHGTNADYVEFVDGASLAALARAAPAIQELDVAGVEDFDDDEQAPGSAPAWTMPHLTTLTISSGCGPCVSVVCAAALLARAPRLRGLCAMFDVPAVPLETNVRALAYVAAAGRAALDRLDVARLPPAAELQAAMAVAAPGGIALDLSTLKVIARPAAVPLDDQQVAWLRSVVAGVDLVDLQLPVHCSASALSRGIFALPAAAFRLCVPAPNHGGSAGHLLVEAARFAAEAARPGQHVCVWAKDVFDSCGTDAIAEAEAIAHGALGKDIRVQIGGQAP